MITILKKVRCVPWNAASTCVRVHGDSVSDSSIAVKSLRSADEESMDATAEWPPTDPDEDVTIVVYIRGDLEAGEEEP